MNISTIVVVVLLSRPCLSIQYQPSTCFYVIISQTWFMFSYFLHSASHKSRQRILVFVLTMSSCSSPKFFIKNGFLLERPRNSLVERTRGDCNWYTQKIMQKTKKWTSTQTQTNSVAVSPQENYTDWATDTWRNLVPTFVDRGVSRGQRGGSATDVKLSFLDRSRYFSFKELLIYPHKGWVDPVPDPLPLRKSCRAGSRTRDLWVSSQKVWRTEKLKVKHTYIGNCRLCWKEEAVYEAVAVWLTGENVAEVVRKRRGSVECYLIYTFSLFLN
jgi:hypothetical protein